MAKFWCAAAIAAILAGPAWAAEENISIETLLAGRTSCDDSQALVKEAVRANVRASVGHLRHGSELLEELVQNDGLVVIGAEYSLETGVVTFFEDNR